MEKKLGKLTAKQEQKMREIRQKWLDKMFKNFEPVDRKKAKGFVKFIYELAGLKEPKILFVDSPLAAQYAANMLKGAQVWDQVEAQVRAQVGAQVGDQVRAQVWDQVRAQVWDQVEAQVWAQVWDQVGDQVRAQVWDQVRAQVWDQVRAQVWDQVEAQVWAQVWDQVRAQVGAQVGDQVRAQVWDQVEAQVWDQVRAQVWDQVRAQVWDQVRAQVWDQVRAQVWDQVRAQVWDQGLECFSSGYSGQLPYDSDWIALYDFFTEIGVINFDKFNQYKDLIDAGIYYSIQLKDLCIVCNRPIYIKRDSNNKLHNEEGSAIRWADSYELFFIHGVAFDKGLYEKVTSPKVTFKEIMAIQNMEQRMAALKIEQNRTKLMEVEGAKMIDKSDRGNELWLVPNIFSQDAYFLRYECPSTGRIYVSGIDPEIGKKGNADECMAWKFNLELDTYKVELTVEK